MASAWIGMSDDTKSTLAGIVILSCQLLWFFHLVCVSILVYLMFSGVALWMQTGERQTARLRTKYLQSVLNKDINFFDTDARDSNIIYHISSDAILVQDAIGDKVYHNTNGYA